MNPIDYFFEYGELPGSAALIAEVKHLRAALTPFVAAYHKRACAVSDSDLYDEQPRSVDVTLGDCRRAERVLATTFGEAPKNDQETPATCSFSTSGLRSRK